MFHCHWSTELPENVPGFLLLISLFVWFMNISLCFEIQIKFMASLTLTDVLQCLSFSNSPCSAVTVHHTQLQNLEKKTCFSTNKIYGGGSIL
jgi:hypothetical protein